MGKKRKSAEQEAYQCAESPETGRDEIVGSNSADISDGHCCKKKKKKSKQSDYVTVDHRNTYEIKHCKKHKAAASGTVQEDINQPAGVANDNENMQNSPKKKKVKLDVNGESKSQTGKQKTTKKEVIEMKERKRKKRHQKKEQKRREKEASQEQGATGAGKAHSEALRYLRQWKEEQQHWKFHKVRQVWLLQHMYDTQQVQVSCFPFSFLTC